MLILRRFRASFFWTMALFGLLLPPSSCTTSHPESFFLSSRRKAEAVKMEVANHSYWDLRVYLERDGCLFPLGRVDRMRTVTFPLSEGMLAHARHYALVTKPVSEGQGFRTDPVAIVPGRLHRWKLLPTAGLFHGVDARFPQI
ncbi:hypothetical protein ACFL3S_07510 [Gemmatimonadota bacterium]